MSCYSMDKALKTGLSIFLRGLLCTRRSTPSTCVAGVVDVNGDDVGYMIDGQFVAAKQMREVIRNVKNTDKKV